MRTVSPITDRGSRELSGTAEMPAVSEIHEFLETARKVLERERRELTAEKRAFERFQRRVAALKTATPQATVAGSGADASTSTGSGVSTETTGATPHSRPSSNRLSEVQDAYTETVMSVSHYDDLYDETWLESVAEEFTEELAAALNQHAQLHPQLQQLLVAAAEQAVNKRTQLLEFVEAEYEAFADADQELSSVREDLQSLLDQPLAQLEFNALRLTRARLETLRERCDNFATKRQTELRRRHREIGVLEHYFYGDFKYTYPILAAIAKLGESIQRGLTVVDRSVERLLDGETNSPHPTGRSEP